ncbi:hypothetical protein BDZ91DRAFT_211101 [Kalaharituber pfeilii]|nr:hypothetical protein BDZ91DRAFT_211101 [Kalaharituber pfeilii]
MSNRTRKFPVVRSRNTHAESGVVAGARGGSESSFPQDAFSLPSPPLSDTENAYGQGVAYLGLRRSMQAADSESYILGDVNQPRMKSSPISTPKATTLNKAMVKEMTGHSCGGFAESLSLPTYTTLPIFFRDIDQQLTLPDMAGDTEEDGESIDLDADLDPKWVEGSKAWRNAPPVYRPRGLSHADIAQLDSQWDGEEEGMRDCGCSVKSNLTSRSKALTKVVSEFTGIEGQDEDENGDDDEDGDDNEHDSEEACEEDGEDEEEEVDTRLPPDLAVAFPETKHPGIVFDHLLLDTPDVEPDEYDQVHSTPTFSIHTGAAYLDPAAAVAKLAVTQNAMAEDLRQLSVAAKAVTESLASVNMFTGPTPNRTLYADATIASAASVAGSSALESGSTNVDMVGGLTELEYYGAGLDMYVPQEEIESQEVAYSLYESGVMSYIEDDDNYEDGNKDGGEEMEDEEESRGDGEDEGEDEDDGIWVFDKKAAQRAAGAVSSIAGRTYPNYSVTDRGTYNYPPSPTIGSAQSPLGLTRDSVSGPGGFQRISASETTGDTESWFDVPVNQCRGKGKERAW